VEVASLLSSPILLFYYVSSLPFYLCDVICCDVLFLVCLRLLSELIFAVDYVMFYYVIRYDVILKI
jgi:hypothetical protein